MKKKKTIYISGKIGSYEISQEVREKFQQVEEQLVSEGWEVVNPASVSYQQDMKQALDIIRKTREMRKQYFDAYTEMLIYDFRQLKKCQAIYMLPGWLDSPGARAEHYFAKAIGKEVIYGALHRPSVRR